MLEPVLQRDQHAVAVADAHVRETTPERRRLDRELGIGQPARAVDDGDRLGAPLRRAVEELGQRHALPHRLLLEPLEHPAVVLRRGEPHAQDMVEGEHVTVAIPSTACA